MIRSMLQRSTGAALALAAMAVATTADAKCTRLGFSVNDYGKDGPTKDAKDLLDKYVAKWAADNGVKKYTTGKKDVKCELFLDFVVFDEHTCRAEATVCWGEGGPASPTSATPGTAPAVQPKPAAKTLPANAPAAPKPKPPASG
jgi:hypothetical protein